MHRFKSGDSKGGSWGNEWGLWFHWRTTCLLEKQSVNIWMRSVMSGGWSVLNYFSRSCTLQEKANCLVCERRSLRSAYHHFQCWINETADCLSNSSLCCINVLWWLHLSSILSWEIFSLSLFKKERGGELHISSHLSLGGCVFKMTGKPIWQHI